MNFWLLLAILWPVQAPEQVNRNGLLLQDFSKRIGEYVKLHNQVKAEIHGLKPTKSAEEIAEYEHRFARRLRETRAGAAQGNIFTPDISAMLRQLIGNALKGPGAASIRASLVHELPVQSKGIRVNYEYPSGIPVQSIPPSLLMNLPALPQEVEYQLAGHDIVIRDIDANLVVDILPNALS